VRQGLLLPWAADSCPCVEKLRTVLPLTVGIRDGAVQLVLTHQRVRWGGWGHVLSGPAKSQLVHEIDALGGEMGKMADRCYLQRRVLNRSKGPAVWALRAQTDKKEYCEVMRKVRGRPRRSSASASVSPRSAHTDKKEYCEVMRKVRGRPRRSSASASVSPRSAHTDKKEYCEVMRKVRWRPRRA
jgi:hypothetical protein